jgi:hypothetical protein
MEDNELEVLYQKFWEFVSKQMYDYDPMAIAGVMSAQAMTIYKTTMSEENFERIAESIYESRTQVKKLNPGYRLQ